MEMMGVSSGTANSNSQTAADAVVRLGDDYLRWWRLCLTFGYSIDVLERILGRSEREEG